MVESHADAASTEVVPVVQPPTPRRQKARAPRAPRAPRPAPQGVGAVVATTSTMVTLVCVWAVLQLLVLSGVAHDREQALLYADFRVQLAETTAPLGPEIAAGAPVAILEIPAIGVEEVVVEGTASGDLLDGPGHLRGTPLPGQRGFSVVMGRAATYGAPFAHLGELRRGDDVEVLTSQGAKTLEVIGVRHEGDPVPAFDDPQAAVVTFVSAEGDGGWLSALTPQTTVYVDAVARESFPTPGGYGLTAPQAEQEMERDTAALPLLALWLALLVGLSVLVVLARQRWSAVLVWTVAGPAAISLAWVATDTGMRLLPNLL
ncbi:sortase [Nocardioides sp. C4-1]|uniref:sortase n=1 Tax=Nocardioides sp. C4-1 TaxID=3151851 RepID=UPI003263903F